MKFLYNLKKKKVSKRSYPCGKRAFKSVTQMVTLNAWERLENQAEML